MARKNKVEAPDVGTQEKPKFDQAAIDAALAGAVTMRDGSPVPSMKKDTPPPLVPPPTAPKSKDVETPDDTENDCKKPANNKKAGSAIASDQKKFGEDCYNFNIDAKKCHYQSAKNEDKSILEYIRAINKKIYDETCKGGFSTNVQFRVTPQDWVNVSHIIDWYRSRGFEVVVKPTTSPAYGKDVGHIDHNFTISWAVVD